jgi:hypothetical protein
MPLSTLEEIRDVLQHRRKHFRELLELSRRQHQHIDAADYTQLMSTLALKQRILGRLDEAKRRYPELTRQWTALRESGLPGVRQECEALLAETETILAELMASEKEGTERLTERREETRRQLEAVSQGVHINQVYADTAPALNHRFLNTNR